MASSNIKLFDENKGNMLTDTEFNISTQRLNGLQTGVASSQLQNKAMYQASLVAYAIAQVMMQNGLNANDTDAVSAFVANLSGTMLQKVYDIATTEEAKAGVATGKWMSPALVKAAINYMKATTAEAQAGTDDTKWMSPALVKTAIDIQFTNRKASNSEAQAGTNNTNWMSPALVKAAIDTLAAKAQNILSDATKTLYGLSSGAVPNDVFVTIKSLVDNANTIAGTKAKVITGMYTGDGGSSRVISLDVTPKAILVFRQGCVDTGYIGKSCALSVTGYNASIMDAGLTSWSNVYSVLGIVDNGFKVNYHSGNQIHTNDNGTKYLYVAIV